MVRTVVRCHKGIDILAEIGGIHTLDEANSLFETRCDQEKVAKLSKGIAARRIQQAAETGARMVLSTCQRRPRRAFPHPRQGHY